MNKRVEEVTNSQAVSDSANDYCSLYYDWDNEAERRAVTETFKQGYYEGYERAEKDTIERACKWLFSHLPILVDCYNEDIHEKADRSEFIKLFRTQMEEQWKKP